MKIPMQMKKSTCPGYFPKTGTLHARSGARTLDTLIERGQNCNDYTIDKRRHRKYNSYVVTPNLATESGC